MNIDLSQYLPEDLTITLGKWQIVSPLPSAKNGKILALLTVEAEKVAESIRRGDNPPYEPQVGQHADVDIRTLLFGQDQVNELETAGCPEIVLSIATLYAQSYWVLGEQAAKAVIDAYMNPQDEDKKAPKGSKPLKNGRRTA